MRAGRAAALTLVALLSVVGCAEGGAPPAGDSPAAVGDPAVMPGGLDAALVGGPPVPPRPGAPTATHERPAVALARAWVAEHGRAPTRRPPSQTERRAAWDCRTTAARCAAVAAAADALAAVYPWRRLGWQIVVTRPSGDAVGMSAPATRTITLRPPDADPAEAAWLFAHEVGHAVWFDVLDEAQRAAYRHARGIGSDVPVHVAPPHRFDSVEEDYAETFAWLMMSSAPRTELGAPRNRDALAAWFPAPPAASP